jgi:hypothetical protein
MSKFLISIGAEASYTEANSNEYLKEIVAYYEFLKVENYYKYKDIEYYPNKQFPADYNFNIFDLGNLSLGSVFIFKSCDVKVLCSGNKPYDLIDIHKAIKLFDDVNLNILFSSTVETEKMRIRKMFDSTINKICFQDYASSLFDGKTNGKIYREIIKDYIIEI